MMRAKKTTQNADDLKVLIVGILCTIMILFGSQVYPRLYEYRWFRDLTRITPFHSVDIYYSSVVNDGQKIVFGGTLTKRRCDFDDLVGYITGQFNQRHRVVVDTSVEDLRGVSGSRPPSNDPESWGPWSIDISNVETYGQPLIPKDFEVIAFHIECPTDPENQSNKFLEAPWADFEIELPDSVYPFHEAEPIVIKEEMQ